MDHESDDPLPWQTLAARVEYENRWTAVIVDEVLLPNGQRYDYTRLRPAGVGVAVVAFDREGRILLEREYRHGVGQVIWQLPGGLADGDEELSAAGLRELLEETGHAPSVVSPDTVRYLGSVWDNPGLGPAESHIVAAWDVAPVAGQRLEATEFLSLHWHSPAWLLDAVRTGEIRERTLVAAVAYLLLNHLI